MVNALRSELKKLLTIRSTYVAGGLGLLFIGFMSFYIEGIRRTQNFMDPHQMTETFTNLAHVTALFATIIAILQIVHEYRYGTIIYTLTTAKSRTVALAAKMVVIIGFTVVYVLAAFALALVAFTLGRLISGNTLVPQELFLTDSFLRPLGYNLAYVLIGSLFAVVARNIVLAFVLVFAIPATVEPLLFFMFKQIGPYLPFNLLQSMLYPNTSFDDGSAAFTFAKSFMIMVIYLVIGWAIAWWLFLKRDAN